MGPQDASYPTVRRVPCRAACRRQDYISQARPVFEGSRTPDSDSALGTVARDSPADERLPAFTQLPFERLAT